MKRRAGLAALVLLAGAILTPAPIAAEVVVTRNGTRVEGTVVSENSNEIVLNTKYGELRFLKMNVKAIERGNASSANSFANTDAAPANPFAADSGSGGIVDPFAAGGAPTADPFAAAPAPPPSSDPFAAAPAPSADPFASASPAAFADPFASAPAAPPAADPFAVGAPAPSAASSGFGGFGIPVEIAAASSAPPPFGGGSVDPFAGSAAAYDPFTAQATSQSADDGFFNPGGLPLETSEAIPTPAAGGTDSSSSRIPSFVPPPEREAPPKVDKGFDAVVFGVHEKAPVEIRASATSDWAPATSDTQLKVNSQIQTKETRTARVVLRGSEDELRLPNDSHVGIEQLDPASNQVTLNLYRGSIWSSVSPRAKADSFRVRTPELTAGVRGTKFQVDRINGGTQVSVFEGVVHVQAVATKAFVTLKANQAVAVNASGQIMDLIAIPVDEAAIRADWNNWATETWTGSSSLAGGAPISSLSQQIAEDNARWQAMNEEHARAVAENKYMDTLEGYAKAFERFASDTGHIPTDEEGFSVLKFDPGISGWNGPYVEGFVPPLDPWKRPLVYKKTRSRSGNVIGRVYSLWQDGRDQGGENASVDKYALVLYFQLDRFKNDPNVVAPRQ